MGVICVEEDLRSFGFLKIICGYIMVNWGLEVNCSKVWRVV